MPKGEKKSSSSGKHSSRGESSYQGGYRSTPYTTNAQSSSAHTATYYDTQYQQEEQNTDWQAQYGSTVLTQQQSAWWQAQVSMYPASGVLSQAQILMQKMPGLQATGLTRDGQLMVLEADVKRYIEKNPMYGRPEVQQQWYDHQQGIQGTHTGGVGEQSPPTMYMENPRAGWPLQDGSQGPQGGQCKSTAYRTKLQLLATGTTMALQKQTLRRQYTLHHWKS